MDSRFVWFRTFEARFEDQKPLMAKITFYPAGSRDVIDVFYKMAELNGENCGLFLDLTS